MKLFFFGDYVTSAHPLPFLLTKRWNASSNLVYNYTSSEALDIETKFDCQYSDKNSPRTGIIGTTSNKLTYRLLQERWRVITLWSNNTCHT
jgi:hypothetical protein